MAERPPPIIIKKEYFTQICLGLMGTFRHSNIPLGRHHSELVNQTSLKSERIMPRTRTSVISWYVYQMISQNILRTHEEKQFFSAKKFRLMATLDITKSHKQILTCTSISELPSNISTRGYMFSCYDLNMEKQQSQYNMYPQMFYKMIQYKSLTVEIELVLFSFSFT